MEYFLLKIGNGYLNSKTYRGMISNDKSEAVWYKKDENITIPLCAAEQLLMDGEGVVISFEKVEVASLYKYLKETGTDDKIYEDISGGAPIEDSIENLENLAILLEACSKMKNPSHTLTYNNYEISFRHAPSCTHGYQEYGDYDYIYIEEKVQKGKENDQRE